MALISMFPWGGGGGNRLNIAYGSSLPISAVDDQIFVITNTPVADFYVSTNEPDHPSAGDVWIQVAQSAHVLKISTVPPYFDLGLTRARQYDGSAWNPVDGYIGMSGTWTKFSLHIPPVGTPLDDYTWEQIDRVSRDGNASLYWQIGDTKNLSIDGVTYTAEILDFDHDDLPGVVYGKAGLTFGLKDCMTTTYQINDTYSNRGGWLESKFRGVLNSTIYSTLPSDLRDVIKSVKKKTSHGFGDLNTIDTTEDLLFLFSEIEITGVNNNSIAGEGAQYSRFAVTESRIKRIDGVASDWWLRSPYKSWEYSSWVCNVGAGGAVTRTGANAKLGISFGFCV